MKLREDYLSQFCISIIAGIALSGYQRWKTLYIDIYYWLVVG